MPITDADIQKIAQEVSEQLHAPPPAYPYRDEILWVERAVAELFNRIESVGGRWAAEYLAGAMPDAADPDAYVKPLINLAESLRRVGLRQPAQRIYAAANHRIVEHCRASGKDLHRGAILANLAICHLEDGRYTRGLAFLQLAAGEDLRRHIAPQHSYAFSNDGIFGQWLDKAVFPAMPAGVLPFVSSHVAPTTSQDLKDLCRWLLRRGDVQLFSALLDFKSVEGMQDEHSESIRFGAIRDLAGLFEEALIGIGNAHNDVAVATSYQAANRLYVAGMICHMHFGSKKDVRRLNPALNANTRPGLFRNAVHNELTLLSVIDGEIDYAGDSAHTVQEVLSRLEVVAGRGGATHREDMLGSRLLLAYRLRNTTSHGFTPFAPGLPGNYDKLLDWMLSAIVGMYRLCRTTGQI